MLLVCTLVLQLTPRGKHTVQSQRAASFLLEISEGHFGTGSSPLPSSETAHGQQRAQPGEAGKAPRGSLSRQGQQHVVTESCTLVPAWRTSLWGDRRGLGRAAPSVPPGSGEVTLTEPLESFSSITQQGCDTRDRASLLSFVLPAQPKHSWLHHSQHSAPS